MLDRKQNTDIDIWFYWIPSIYGYLYNCCFIGTFTLIYYPYIIQHAEKNIKCTVNPLYNVIWTKFQLSFSAITSKYNIYVVENIV